MERELLLVLAVVTAEEPEIPMERELLLGIAITKVEEPEIPMERELLLVLAVVTAEELEIPMERELLLVLAVVTAEEPGIPMERELLLTPVTDTTEELDTVIFLIEVLEPETVIPETPEIVADRGLVTLAVTTIEDEELAVKSLALNTENKACRLEELPTAADLSKVSTVE